MRRKKRYEAPKPIEPLVIDVADLDSRTVYMLGLPGHRTAMNRSGLGYLATQAEWGYMRGLMVRWLATGRFRTRNPIYLLTMLFVGLIIGVIPVAVIVYEIIWYSKTGMLLLFCIFPQLGIGVALFINAILSILDRNGNTITGD